MNTIPCKPSRIASIDVFRAITMVTMIFVNDFWSVSNVPHWLEHAKFDEDMLGFSDIVFPSFLFIMGMSIPLSIESKLQKGATKLGVLENIISRTIALLVMGLFLVNFGDEGLSSDLWISRALFCIIMLTGFILVWNHYPKPQTDRTKKIQQSLKIIGTIILIVLVYIYRDSNGGMFQQRWWGILGLIGWAYSFCAILYLYNRHRPKTLIITYFIFVLFSILGSMKYLGPFSGIIPGNGCFQAFAMSGLLLVLLFLHSKVKFNITKKLWITAFIGVTLLFAGLLSHPIWIISKIQATPTWLFLCSGISVLLYIPIYWLTDIKGKTSWFNLIKPAGTATLTCYLMPYLLYTLFTVMNFQLPQILLVSPLGLLKCFLFALVTVGVTALLGKIGIKLKI